MADALPRERWVLTAGVLFVVLGGLFPNAIVAVGTMGTEAQAVSVAHLRTHKGSGAVWDRLRSIGR